MRWGNQLETRPLQSFLSSRRSWILSNCKSIDERGRGPDVKVGAAMRGEIQPSGGGWGKYFGHGVFCTGGKCRSFVNMSNEKTDTESADIERGLRNE